MSATAESVLRLSDDQLAAFDVEYVRPNMFRIVEERIAKDFPSGDMRVLDIGGGNGVFADQLLARYPHAKVTLLDNAPSLLNRNKPHERKKLICDTAENLSRFSTERFDMLCLHWVLHHMVKRTWRSTVDEQGSILRHALALLAPGGRLCVFENCYQGFGIPALSSWFVFQMTSSRMLAKITRIGGANTAGVGVAFHDEQSWRRLFHRSGWKEAAPVVPFNINIGLKHRAVGARSVHVGNFWLAAADDASTPAH